MYCTAIREGGEREWDFAAYQFSKENDTNEQKNLLNGMSCSNKPWLVDKLLSSLIDPNVVKTSLTMMSLRSVAIKPEGIIKTWNFVKENWNELFLKHGTGISALITSFSSLFNTQYLLNDVCLQIL